MAAHAGRALAFVVGLLALGAACARRETAPAGAKASGSARASRGAEPPPADPVAGSALLARANELTRARGERVAERSDLVAGLERDGIRDRRVLDALRSVPRHRFVPDAVSASAYEDRPLPIGSRQTISQPYVVAAMTEAVAPKPTDRCLEIGTGSGYQAAVLQELCGRTYSIEYLEDVFEFGARNLQALGYAVELRHGDGYGGWPEAAPFDVVVVTAAPERVPEPLLAQLSVGGRLVIPVGPSTGAQTLELWTRVGATKTEADYQRRAITEVRFVPFLGDHGASR